MVIINLLRPQGAVIIHRKNVPSIHLWGELNVRCALTKKKSDKPHLCPTAASNDNILLLRNTNAVLMPAFIKCIHRFLLELSQRLTPHSGGFLN